MCQTCKLQGYCTKQHSIVDSVRHAVICKFLIGIEHTLVKRLAEEIMFLDKMTINMNNDDREFVKATNVLELGELVNAIATYSRKNGSPLNEKIINCVVADKFNRYKSNNTTPSPSTIHSSTTSISTNEISKQQTNETMKKSTVICGNQSTQVRYDLGVTSVQHQQHVNNTNRSASPNISTRNINIYMNGIHSEGTGEGDGGGSQKVAIRGGVLLGQHKKMNEGTEQQQQQEEDIYSSRIRSRKGDTISKGNNSGEAKTTVKNADKIITTPTIATFLPPAMPDNDTTALITKNIYNKAAEKVYITEKTMDNVSVPREEYSKLIYDNDDSNNDISEHDDIDNAIGEKKDFTGIQKNEKEEKNKGVLGATSKGDDDSNEEDEDDRNMVDKDKGKSELGTNTKENKNSSNEIQIETTTTAAIPVTIATEQIKEQQKKSSNLSVGIKMEGGAAELDKLAKEAFEIATNQQMQSLIEISGHHVVIGGEIKIKKRRAAVHLPFLNLHRYHNAMTRTKRNNISEGYEDMIEHYAEKCKNIGVITVNGVEKDGVVLPIDFRLVVSCAFSPHFPRVVAIGTVNHTYRKIRTCDGTGYIEYPQVKEQCLLIEPTVMPWGSYERARIEKQEENGDDEEEEKEGESEEASSISNARSEHILRNVFLSHRPVCMPGLALKLYLEVCLHFFVCNFILGTTENYASVENITLRYAYENKINYDNSGRLRSILFDEMTTTTTQKQQQQQPQNRGPIILKTSINEPVPVFVNSTNIVRPENITCLANFVPTKTKPKYIMEFKQESDPAVAAMIVSHLICGPLGAEERAQWIEQSDKIHENKLYLEYGIMKTAAYTDDKLKGDLASRYIKFLYHEIKKLYPFWFE
jgi:hypothetical protein